MGLTAAEAAGKSPENGFPENAELRPQQLLVRISVLLPGSLVKVAWRAGQSTGSVCAKGTSPQMPMVGVLPTKMSRRRAFVCILVALAVGDADGLNVSAACRSGCTFRALCPDTHADSLRRAADAFLEGQGTVRRCWLRKKSLPGEAVSLRRPPSPRPGIAELLTVEGEDSHCSSRGDSIS